MDSSIIDDLSFRQNITTDEKTVKKIIAIIPNSDPGYQNIIKNLVSDADIKEKTDFVNLLKKLDPSNTSKYQEILN